MLPVGLMDFFHVQSLGTIVNWFVPHLPLPALHNTGPTPQTPPLFQCGLFAEGQVYCWFTDVTPSHLNEGSVVLTCCRLHAEPSPSSTQAPTPTPALPTQRPTSRSHNDDMLMSFVCVFPCRKLGDFCLYHVQAAYRKQSARRSELQGRYCRSFLLTVLQVEVLFLPTNVQS